MRVLWIVYFWFSVILVFCLWERFDLWANRYWIYVRERERANRIWMRYIIINIDSDSEWYTIHIHEADKKQKQVPFPFFFWFSFFFWTDTKPLASSSSGGSSSTTRSPTPFPRWRHPPRWSELRIRDASTTSWPSLFSSFPSQFA